MLEGTTPANSFGWMADTLMDLPQEPCANDAKAHPSHGTIKPGSTTHKVLSFLQKHPTRWYRLSQIAVGTGCRDKTVSWALHQLKAQGLVEAVTLSRQANSRYLRYCITRDRAIT